MSQTTTRDDAITTDATRSPRRQRSQLLPAIALGVATVAAILSIVAISTTDAGSTTPPQPAGQQQNVPAAQEAPHQLVLHHPVDDCGRPIVTGRLACR